MAHSNKGKHHARTIDKMHLLVRLELANPLLNVQDIAKLAGVPLGRYAIFKRLPLYQQIHNQYFSGVITRLDKRVDQNLTLTQETLKFAVPVAMQALLKQALQEKDLRVQNKACNDILDRDGHFAKVTRVGLATPEQGGVAAAVDKDNDVANALIKAMQQTTKQPNNNTHPPSISDPTITNTTQ